MIIPIGHSESSVRRYPWVTFAIMVVCTAVFLATDLEGLVAVPEPSDYLLEAADYWRERAYLDAEPEVVREVAYDVMPNQRSQYIELLKSGAFDMAPDDPELLADEQAELDELTALALEEAGPQGLPPEATEHAFYHWGLVPARAHALSYVTYIFLHASWLHLLGNLFLLFLAGPALEDRWGRPLFALFFVAAGLFAGGFYAAIASSSVLPMVGASGAIAGVLGAFFVRFFKSRIRFLYLALVRGKPTWGTFSVPAALVGAAWVATEIGSAVTAGTTGVQGGVAYWAHVGGLLFGVAGGLGMKFSGLERRISTPPEERRSPRRKGNPVATAAVEAREEGDLSHAFELLKPALETEPDDPELCLAWWDTCVAAEQPERGAAAGARLVESHVDAGRMTAATTMYRELKQRAPDGLPETATLMRLLPTLRADDADLARSAAYDVLDPRNAAPTSAQALKLFSWFRAVEAPLAARAARVAANAPELHEVKRAQLETFLAEHPDEEPRTPAPAPEPLAEDDGEFHVEATAHEAPTTPSLDTPADDADLSAVDPSTEVDTPPMAADDAFELEPTRFDEDTEPIISEAPSPAPLFAGIKILHVRATQLDADGLTLVAAGSDARRTAWNRIQAVGCARVPGASGPEVLIDLLVNWNNAGESPLRALRLHGPDALELSVLVPEVSDPELALRALLETILERSGAIALPESHTDSGFQIGDFDTIEAYEREILQVDPHS